MSETIQPISLPGGVRVDHAAIAAHVMQPAHAQGVISSRGLEEGEKLCPAPNRWPGRSRSTPTALSPG